MLDLKSEIDEEELDRLTITVEEIKSLVIPSKKKSVVANAAESSEKLNLLSTEAASTISEEEIQRKTNYINHASENLNRPTEDAIDDIFKEMGLINTDVFDDYCPDYEFRQDDFLTPEEILADTNSGENAIEESSDDPFNSFD